MSIATPSDETASIHGGPQPVAPRPGRSSETSVTLGSFRGVDDPNAFARQLQEWKLASTDRNHLPRYRVIKRLGQGSQGLVFSVADRDCLREVALKTLHAGGRSRDDISRFVHEAQITAQLEHPGIAPVHDLDVLPDGTVFYTMKKVEGRTLSDLIGDASRAEHAAIAPEAPPPPSVDENLQILLKVCDTIAFAHSRGVIHRDLKPRNLMIGRYGEVLVMDWGLAKILDGQPDPREGEERQVLSLRSIEDGLDIHKTMDGCAVGTPAYMSPEQARGESADRRSDIYSIGVILYLCLSGESPYERGRVRYTLEQAAAGTWTRLDHRAEGRKLPKRLVAIVHKCMALKPDDRYQSVEGLTGDLRAFLAGQAVAAYRETPLDRTVRSAVRYRRGLALTAGIAVLAFAAWGLQAWAESGHRDDVVAELRRAAAQHELMGELEDARRDLERIVDQRPDDQQALDGLQRLRQSFAKRSEDQLAIRRKQDAAGLVHEGDRRVAADDDESLRGAMEAYLGALGLVPGDPVIAARYRQTVQRIAAREERARADAQAADRAVRARALDGRAAEAEAQGDLRTAIGALEAALQLDPTDERTRHHAVLVARSADLSRVAEMRTRQAEAAGWIAEVRLALGRGDAAAARLALDRARGADGEHPELPALTEAVRSAGLAESLAAAHGLLEQAQSAIDDSRRLLGLIEEAEPPAVPALRRRRAAALVDALERLHRAESLVPGTREIRATLVGFHLERLEEAEAAGVVEDAAASLAVVRAFDDGSQRAAVAGLAAILLPDGAPTLLFTPLDQGDPQRIEPGALVSLAAGPWRIAGPSGPPIERRLRRGELFAAVWPTALPEGASFIPAGRAVVSGKPVEVASFILGTPEPLAPLDAESAEAAVRARGERERLPWRLPTIAERRIVPVPFGAPELVRDADSYWLLIADGRRRHLATGVREPGVVVRPVIAVR